MQDDNRDHVIYVRCKGFLTESSEWSFDINDAEFYSEDCAFSIAQHFYSDKPIILKLA